MSLVLSILSVSLFTISHCVNLGISSFINSISLRVSLLEKKRFVSSANRMSLASDDTLQISLIYIKKSKGPKIEPWGTPQVIYSRDETELLNCTN